MKKIKTIKDLIESSKKKSNKIIKFLNKPLPKSQRSRGKKPNVKVKKGIRGLLDLI